jgi:hypothetical protein
LDGRGQNRRIEIILMPEPDLKSSLWMTHVN